MSKLKPCPFCEDGGKPKLEPQGTDAATHCYKCGARGPIIDNDEHYSSPSWENRKHQIGKEAANAWNARPLEDTLRAIVKEWETTGLPAPEAMARVRDAVKEVS